MPSLRITAVAALATAALVVPATASAKDEAATAEAVGTQPVSPAAPALMAAAQSGSPPPVIGQQPNNPLAAAGTKDEAATAAAISPQPASSQPAAESEWTSCATEGARCEFTGTRQVRYGANGKFTLPRTLTDGVACNNGVFGDPVPWVVKECQVAGLSQTKDEAATAAAISTQPSGVNVGSGGGGAGFQVGQPGGNATTNLPGDGGGSPAAPGAGGGGAGFGGAGGGVGDGGGSPTAPGAGAGGGGFGGAGGGAP